MSSTQALDSDEKQRIEHLAGQECARKGVMLLLQGQDAMSPWMRLQMHMLRYNNISLMPLSSAHQLITTIENLRNHCNSVTNHGDEPDEQVMRREIVRNCVRGRPLADCKIANLMSRTTGLSHLATLVETEEGQLRICNALGEEDGRRLISYFQDGPKTL